MHLSSRMRNQQFLRLLECSYGLLTGDAGKIIQKVCERMAAFDIVDSMRNKASVDAAPTAS